MYDISGILNFSTISLSVGFSSLGVAIGETLSSNATLQAINIQPKARNEITKAAILGMAITETAAIVGLVLSILLLINNDSIVANKFYYSLSNIGIAISISLSGLVIGIMSSFPVRYACLAIARQPFLSNKIINIMMVTLSFIQTPIIFSFIISLFINYQAVNSAHLIDSIKHISSGICIGIGSIGPAIGLAIFAKSACQAIGYNKETYNKILTFSFVSAAFIETPIMFSLITSLLLLTLSINTTNTALYTIVMICAALCTGISNIAPGISSGRTSSAACMQIAKNPDDYLSISKISIIAQGFIESISIYGWLVSLLLIFFVK